MAGARPGAAARIVLYVQAVVYVVTGAWPLVHLESFEWVTGEKYDDFLVHTVGLLLLVVGAVVLRALRRATLSPELLWVAAGTASSLLVIDVAYWWMGRLPPIYLVDAAAEAVFVAGALSLLRVGAGHAHSK
jgi:hypothetical protein